MNNKRLTILITTLCISTPLLPMVAKIDQSIEHLEKAQAEITTTIASLSHTYTSITTKIITPMTQATNNASAKLQTVQQNEESTRNIDIMVQFLACITDLNFAFPPLKRSIQAIKNTTLTVLQQFYAANKPLNYNDPSQPIDPEHIYADLQAAQKKFTKACASLKELKQALQFALLDE